MRVAALFALCFAVAGCGLGTCRYPVHRLELSISPAACQALSDQCAPIRVVARSPQISSLIAAGSTPCSSTASAPHDGCVVSAAREWSRLFCLDVGECGRKSFEVAGVFGPAADDGSISITDTVSYCAYDEDGKPLGACTASLVDQCEGDATLVLAINAVP